MTIPFFHPSNLTREFELEPGEVVLAEVRKHWFVFTLELLPFAIIAVLPFAFAPLLSIAPPLANYANLASFGTGIGRTVLGIWLLIVWTSAWGAFTRYYLNVWVLTNLRVMEVIQHNYFHREVSSVLLNRVQDVTTEVKGALFSLLNIGNIHVQSAGTVDEFHMDGIGGPAALRDIILKKVSEQSKTDGV